MSNSSTNVAIIGAGITGAAAAYRLSQLGILADVYEIDSNVGGRMARFRFGEAVFDHGAQFFTTRGNEFRTLVEAAETDGAAEVWTRGFGETPDGYERWRGVPDMTALAAWLLRKSGAALHVESPVTDLGQLSTSGIILTPPIPVSISLARDSGLEPPPDLMSRLEAIQYKRTIAVLLVLHSPPAGMPPGGGIQLLDDQDLAFITDNCEKGVSSVPAITIHLSNDASLALWDQSDEAVIDFAIEKTKSWVEGLDVADHSITRWRYAGPVEVLPESSASWGTKPSLVIAGEAFNGPKVEGAFTSGIDAANRVAKEIR
ncbi:MAG: NAD(P)-binding protein [Acidimicrobiales bacterium]|nr:NAD(P)-binding protein [Acidimicrobiales bacterium]